MRTVRWAFILHTLLQAQAPLAVEAVVDALTGQTRLAPGSRALIRLNANVALQSVTAQVGGRQAALLGVDGADVHIAIPVDLDEGPTTLIVASRGITTPAFAITLVSHAPALASTAIWPGSYCPIRAPWGTSLVAYGLGATNPAVPAGAVAPSAPLASTILRPVLMIAGRQAEVLSSALVPDRANDGSYRIDFRVPQDTRPGTHPVVLNIAGAVSNTVMLRVPGIIVMSALTGNGRIAAPESLMSAYSCAAPLAVGEVFGDPRNPGTALGGTTARVADSFGVERVAPLLYVSPNQVNLIIPKGTASGLATLFITTGSEDVSRGIVEVRAIAPELMQIGGYPAALVMRVRDGAVSFEPVVRIQNGAVEVTPLDFGPSTDQLFLLLFGTGLRGRSSPAGVKAVIGDVEIGAEYAGPQGEFAGLDQVNIRLPRSLAGDSSRFPYFALVVDGTYFVNAGGDDMYLPIK